MVIVIEIFDSLLDTGQLKKPCTDLLCKKKLDIDLVSFYKPFA